MKSLERTARKVRKGHYVATHNNSPSPPYHASTNRAYFSDGDDSRAPSERTLSEYAVTNERTTPPQAPMRKSRSTEKSSPLNPPSRPPPRAPSALSYDHGGETGDIYVTSAAYKTPSEISRYSMPHRTYHHHPSKPTSVYSVASSRRTGRSHTSRRAGAKVEAMSAPNPFCPNLRGPFFVWVLGIVFLIFGFATLIGSMIYCVIVCRDVKTPAQLRNEDLIGRNIGKRILATRHMKSIIKLIPMAILLVKSAIANTLIEEVQDIE
ncbi:hypothetical protein PVAND_000672 [Polypedilum vanderplanki]|uniref:Uncharacterized protein n=1 Tax=Polypedilum vanderplanki TaxID=319348 RepID=A0A9J6BKN8_POLVA|nr:hypothetical protein PVAND_000672 [Polypedilum vanderplanki]